MMVDEGGRGALAVVVAMAWRKLTVHVWRLDRRAVAP
jgi:hypothetical protein